MSSTRIHYWATKLLMTNGGLREWERLRRMYRIEEIYPEVPAELPETFFIDIRGGIRRLMHGTPDKPNPGQVL